MLSLFVLVCILAGRLPRLGASAPNVRLRPDGPAAPVLLVVFWPPIEQILAPTPETIPCAPIRLGRLLALGIRSIVEPGESRLR